MNVILIGFRGTGKTTIGRTLAIRLGLPFIDADELLEQRAGKSIAQIFAEQGENFFRDLESSILSELVAGSNQVIALGGGAVLRPENRQLINSGGAVVWLQADADLIESRLREDPTTAARRPALTNLVSSEEIRNLLNVRRPFYEQCADYSVRTDQGSIDAIVEQVVCLVVPPKLEPS